MTTPHFYRSDDPLENFKIRICIREVSRLPYGHKLGSGGSSGEAAGTVASSNGTVGGGGSGDVNPRTGRKDSSTQNIEYFEEDMVISWQEKVNGPSDLVKINKGEAQKAALAERTGDRPPGGRGGTTSHGAGTDAKQQKNKKDVTTFSNIMLYTYVDRDRYLPMKNPVLVDGVGNFETEENYLGVAVLGPGSKVLNDARKKKAEERVFREKPFKEMHICLATDVDIDALKDKNVWDPSFFYTEHVLCSIKLYHDGLFEVSPGFSGIIEEFHGTSIAINEVAPSMFLSDNTVATGIRKGFKVSTHRVRSNRGSEFEYCIQNVNDLFLPQQIEDVRKFKMSQDNLTAARSRGIFRGGDNGDVGAQWKQDPPAKSFHKSISFMGDIVSGSGFDGDHIFVNYQIILPQDNWELRVGNLSDGVHESAVSQKDRNLDGYADSADAAGVLRGTTHTAVVRERKRGLSTIISRPRWRGNFPSVPFDDFTSILLGIGFFILTVLAIILGADYPFWIVPALVIVFVVGTGTPGGRTQVVLSAAKKASELGDFGAHKTQNSNNQITGPLISSPIAHFNHLFQFSCDVKNDISISGNAQGFTTESPTLLLQVFSVGLMDRYSLEGYGYVKLPNKSGPFDVEVKTWRPVGGIQNKLKDHFLGHSMRLREDAFVGVGDASLAAVNKFGMQTEVAGSIRIRCNTIVTTPSLAVVKAVGGGSNVGESTKASTQLRRTVDEILQNFKSSSMGGGGFGNRSMSNSSSTSSLNSSRLSLNLDSSAKADKLSEILARARAKVGGASSLLTPTNTFTPSPTNASPFFPSTPSASASASAAASTATTLMSRSMEAKPTNTNANNANTNTNASHNAASRYNRAHDDDEADSSAPLLGGGAMRK